MPSCCGGKPAPVIQREVRRGNGHAAIRSLDDLTLRGSRVVENVNSTLEQPTVSLHCLRGNFAVFVEVPKTVDVYGAGGAAALHKVQLDHAVRIFEVPVPVFRKFSEHVGKPKCGCLLVSSTGHCGSALLSDALSSPSATTLMAPLCLTNAAVLQCRPDIKGTDLGNWLQEDVREIVRMCFSVLLKDFPAGHLVVIMTQSQALSIAPLVGAVLPGVRQLYLYRNPEPTISSFAEFADASLPNWLISLAARSWGRRLMFSWLMPLALGERTDFFLLNMVDDQVEFCRTHRTEFLSREKHAAHGVMWAANVRRALQIIQRREAPGMASLKYESILAEPDKACAALLRFCGLPCGKAQAKAAAAAMKEESKEMAVISTPGFSKEERTLFDEIFDMFDIPTEFNGSLALPGDLLGATAQTSRNLVASK